MKTSRPHDKVEASDKNEGRSSTDSSSDRSLVFNRWAATIALCLLSIPLYLMFQANSKERKHRQRSNAKSSFRSLHMNQEFYREQSGLDRYGTLAELAQHDLIDQELSTGIKDGYRFKMVLPSGENARYKYSIYATPINKPTNKESLHYYTDQSGVIRHADGRPATADDWDACRQHTG